MSASTAQQQSCPMTSGSPGLVAFVPIPVSITSGDPQMNSFFEQAQLLTRLWMDTATKMAAAGLRQDPQAAPSETARAYRSAVLDAMTASFDQYMRSPQALEIVRQSMDAAIGFRKQWNDMLTRMHHEMQGTAKQDIDSLLLSVQHLETRVLDCMEQLSSRLESISRRLDALEVGSNHKSNGETTAAPERATRRPAKDKAEKTQE